MVARDFSELACWQLANELKIQVYAVLKRPTVARDVNFCNQIRDSARSATRNIAEGFGKYDPPEFRRYLGIAVGSLKETQNHLRDGLSQSYITGEEFGRLSLIARRARKAALGLMSYLESCPRKWKRQHTARRAENGAPAERPDP
jgi:four helix bundle protein